MAKLTVTIDEQLLTELRFGAKRENETVDVYVAKTLSRACSTRQQGRGESFFDLMHRLGKGRTVLPYTREEMNER